MITEQDLQAAIAECQGERNPNANTCIKLASYLTIREHMYPERKEDLRLIPEPTGYSYAPAPEPPEEHMVEYSSNTDFGRTISLRKAADLWPILDELVEAVQVLQPRLYNSFMEKIQ